MSDFYTYRNKVAGERRRRRMMAVLLVVLAVLLAAAGWFWFEGGGLPALGSAVSAAPETEANAAAAETEATAAPAETQAPEAEEAEAAEAAEAAAADAPRRILPEVDTAVWDTSEEVEQTIDTEYLNTDYRMAALPALGTVTRDYFDTVTFVGDSLASGLGIYDSGYKNAQFAAYIGAGPNSFVNNVSMQNAVTKVTETPMEAIVATQPDYVYIMLGTNSLVQQGNEEGFIAYYERLIDMLREQLDPGVIYYIQAIPAVQEWVKDSKPGLDNDRITTVNNLLANMALRKGCYFVNPCEVLNADDGSQVDDYETSDGIHLQPSGYRAWANYLATHTAWNRRSQYTGQNPYYIYGA